MRSSPSATTSGSGARPSTAPGGAGFLGATFLRRLNAGDAAGARDAILWWRQPKAIRTRRAAEAEQFATPYARALPRATTALAPVATPPRPSAPALAPVVPPPTHPWRDAVGAWLAAHLGPPRAHGEVPSPAPRG